MEKKLSEKEWPLEAGIANATKQKIFSLAREREHEIR